MTATSASSMTRASGAEARTMNVLAVAPDAGLLALRLMVGAVGVFHGAQKLFGAFGGHGIRGFAGFLETLNVPAPTLSAYLAGGAEFFGGLLVAIGLMTRLAALPFAFAMLVAIVTVHGGAFSAQNNGMEYPLTLLVILVCLALTGPGRFSADRLILRSRR